MSVIDSQAAAGSFGEPPGIHLFALATTRFGWSLQIEYGRGVHRHARTD